MTQEFLAEIHKTHAADIITAEQLFALSEPQLFQYIVSASWDWQERKAIISCIGQHNLDLITVIHDTCLLGQNPKPVVEPGTFVFAYSMINLGATVGKNCIIGAYSLIGHYSVVGSNCVLRPGVMITGKSVVGDHCIFNTRSTVTNKALVTDDVELKAFSNITKNIDQPGTYAGTPVRKILSN